MQYVSTRGTAPGLGFEDVILTGLAADGGLYVPEQWPVLSDDEWRSLRGKSYADIALAVMSPFVAGAIEPGEFRQMINDAYAGFDHPAVTPLTQLDANHWLLELYHGPTLAFKDVALQLLVRLMNWALEKRDEYANVVVATSGDTGGAAIEAFRHSKRARVFCLHPDERVSPVQRRQMTTVDSPSIFNIAIKGTFDDCQDLVKAMFNHKEFRDKYKIAGVNSINWARIMAQVVYYATTALALGGPDRKVSFTVPTGNFGDIFAGYVAKKMGLPIDRLVIATNSNDILDRTVRTGRYEVTGVHETASPSMDIQVSSNFERVLFDLYDRDADKINSAMSGLKQSGAFSIDEPQLVKLRQLFASGRTDEEATAECIRQTLETTGKLIDPHTAVAYNVARNIDSVSPMVTLSTAHPAKFPAAVKKACGIDPALPPHMADLFERQEKYEILANDIDVVEDFIRSAGRDV